MAEPTFLSRGSTPTESDNKWTILQRILGAVRQISSSGSGGVGAVYSGHYAGGVPSQTPTASAATAYDLDAGNRVWFWDGAAWF